MINHYFKIAFRSLIRNKMFSFINILGLAVGMGVGLLIYQYIHFELSYDQFHTNARHTYRVTQNIIRNGEDLGTGVYTPYALGVAVKENIPEVIDFVRVNPMYFGLVVANVEKNILFQEEKIWYVDSNFFQMFDFPLKYGDRFSSLHEKHQIVISYQASLKYFGDTDPVGKNLKISGGSYSGNFIVSGVLQKLPMNSHMQFDILMPLQFVLENWRAYREDNGWEENDFVTYVTLNEKADPKTLENKVDQLFTTYAGKELEQANESSKIELQPITDIHLKSAFQRELASNNGNIQEIHFFGLIALFILLVAWVNYINLSTAQAIHRAKEVGVRKTIGASRKQLIWQFIFESGLTNFTAAIISIFIAYLLLPVLNYIIGKELIFQLLVNFEFWIVFVLAIIFATFLAGLYPAFILSSFKPVSMFNTGKVLPYGNLNLRKSLIAFQFMMSALFISGTYLIYTQIHYMKNQDLGIDMKKILVVNGPRVVLDADKPVLFSKYEAFRNDAKMHNTISSISASSSVPGKGFMTSVGMCRMDAPLLTKELNLAIVDTKFTQTYDFEFLAGGKFSDEIPPSKWVIINEEAIKTFGFKSPGEAINENLVGLGDTLTIVGVVKNVHWSSLKEAKSPVMFLLDNEYGAYFSIKMSLSNIKESIAHIETSYKSTFPDDPFEYFFLDEGFNKQYQADLQFGNLFSAFSILAIFIACLGLFALVSFSATLRIKEIGIRKVLGASIGNLMFLLSREYIWLLVLANALAVPAIIIGGKAWLNNYAYKVGLGLELFLLPGLVLFVVSLLTVSYRTFVTARMNPVDTLKTE